MSNIRAFSRRFMFTLCAAGLTLTPTIQAMAQVVGVNAAIRNRVDIRPAGATKPLPAVLKQRVRLNDMVQTQAQSQLQLLLLDESQFTIGARAQVTIDRFVFDPDRNITTMGASVARGAFRFMSGRGKPSPSGGSTIRTPVASMGIRGTMVEGVVGPEAIAIARQLQLPGSQTKGDPATATLIVLRGPGPRAAAFARPGVIDVQAGSFRVTLNRPMQAIYIPGRDRDPIGPFILSSDGLDRLHLLLIPTLSGLSKLTSRIGTPGEVGTAQTSTKITETASEGTSGGNKSRGIRGLRKGHPLAIAGGIPAMLATIGIISLASSNGKRISQ